MNDALDIVPTLPTVYHVGVYVAILTLLRKGIRSPGFRRIASEAKVSAGKLSFILNDLEVLAVVRRVRVTHPSGLDGRTQYYALGYDAILPTNRDIVLSPSESGFVYFIAGSGAVKIGYSSKPNQRLQALQKSTPNSLTLLKAVPGTVADEKALHRRFATYQIRGEWFRHADELASYIRGLE